MSLANLDSASPAPALGSDFSGSLQLDWRCAEVLMRTDTDSDDNEISEYQLLMKSLACQLQKTAGGLCTADLSAVLHRFQKSVRNIPPLILFSKHKKKAFYFIECAWFKKGNSYLTLSDTLGNYVQLLYLCLTSLMGWDLCHAECLAAVQSC